jgi:hypothetical protein
MADGSLYRMSVPAKSLWGTASISNLILTNLRDLTFSPLLECHSIPYEEISWLSIAGTFQPYQRVTATTNTLGFADFASLYNNIFTATKYTRPSNLSSYTKKGDRTLGYWHHNNGSLWLSQQRLLLAIRELTCRKNLSRDELDACFGDHVARVTTTRGEFFVFPEAMLQVTEEELGEKITFLAV